jgi:hypothetical protein
LAAVELSCGGLGKIFFPLLIIIQTDPFQNGSHQQSQCNLIDVGRLLLLGLDKNLFRDWLEVQTAYFKSFPAKPNKVLELLVRPPEKSSKWMYSSRNEVGGQMIPEIPDNELIRESDANAHKLWAEIRAEQKAQEEPFEIFLGRKPPKLPPKESSLDPATKHVIIGLKVKGGKS